MSDRPGTLGPVIEEPDPGPQGPLVEFPPLAARVRTAVTVLAALALVAVVIDGLVNGLSFTVMIRWLSAFVVGLVVVVGVNVALHALRGAGAAQRQGERLAGDDVGLVPPRRRSD